MGLGLAVDALRLLKQLPSKISKTSLAKETATFNNSMWSLRWRGSWLRQSSNTKQALAQAWFCVYISLASGATEDPTTEATAGNLGWTPSLAVNYALYRFANAAWLCSTSPNLQHLWFLANLMVASHLASNSGDNRSTGTLLTRAQTVLEKSRPGAVPTIMRGWYFYHQAIIMHYRGQAPDAMPLCEDGFDQVKHDLICPHVACTLAATRWATIVAQGK